MGRKKNKKREKENETEKEKDTGASGLTISAKNGDENDLKKKVWRKADRRHKDGVFRLLFDSEEKIRELYNALEGTNYGTETPVCIKTLDNAIFLDVKNDLAFTIGEHFVVLIEHQSTWSWNMPVRMLCYLCRIYERMFDRKLFYRGERMALPVPEFFLFYNGDKDIPEESIMKLSDSFSGEAPENTVELVVKVFNVRYNKGAKLLERCNTLAEYSLLVSYIQENREQGMELEDAIEQAVRRCQRENVLIDFLNQYGTEVLGMLFDVVTKEEYGDIREEEGFEKGLDQGLKQGVCQERKEIAKALRANGMEIPEIARIIKLPETEIEKLLQ